MTSRVIECKQPYHYCAGKPYQGELYGLAYLRAGNTGAVFAVYRLDHADCRAIAAGIRLALLARPDTAQVVIDLYLMAGLAGCWMVRDNCMRGSAGIAVLPYLLLTVVFVSLGPLLYLVIRGVAEGRQP